MKKQFIITFCLLLLSMTVNANNLPTPENPWLRAAPPNANMLAAYVHLNNESNRTITLIGAQCELFKMTEIHRTVEVDGIYKMREQKKIEIKSGETLVMEPGGLHIMLMMPQESLKLGQKVAMTLRYETASGNQLDQKVSFEVQKAP